MGGTESKPKNDKNSSSSSSASRFSSRLARLSSRAVVPVTHGKDVAKSTSVVPLIPLIPLIELMLISMPNTPRELVLLILSYGTPSLLTASPDPKQFFIRVPRCTLFYDDDIYFNLAVMDQHCIWGRPEEFKKKLAEVKIKSEEKSDPLFLTRLFTTIIDGEDHRGPGFIPAGTLFQRSIYVGDILNEDEKSGETMAEMVGRYVIEICGEEEFKKQLEPVPNVMKEEGRKKAAIEVNDKKALYKVSTILKNADKLTLESNAELKTALTEYESQLREPGNENIIQEAGKFFSTDYSGCKDYAKNKFAKNRIIGLAQLMRLSACDLQICFRGLYHSLNGERFDKIIEKRIDVREKLDVLSSGTNTYSLGFNAHLGIFGLDCGFTFNFFDRLVNLLENLCLAKASRYKKSCENWTILQTASRDFSSRP